MKYDVVIVGAGAAGLMAASQFAKNGKKTLLVEHTNKIGEKIRISGGGRCNFTNLYASPKNYLSENPHFAISALSRYTQHDFIKLVESYNIDYHEKKLGQLFCDGLSKQIINMLLEECKKYDALISTNIQITSVEKSKEFILQTSIGKISSGYLVIASGGLSIPKLGASNFGYNIAKQFGLNIIEPRPALVPLTVSNNDLPFYKNLSGRAIDSIVKFNKQTFRENILFTHRGLSGPAILQISSYLKNFPIKIISNLLPEIDLKEIFSRKKQNNYFLNNLLKEYLPNSFVDSWCAKNNYNKKLIDYKIRDLQKIADKLHNFETTISGTEGYAKAEVTAGGVDTKELSSKNMESKKIPGLFFIGEIVDVTGWLGGYNFQWAWSSAYAAGNS